MRRLKLILSFIAVLASGFAGSKVFAQQNIQFTQYIFNSISVNPAYAGYKEEWFAQLALRRQWTGLDGAPQTGQLSIDGVVNPEKKNVGLGLQITADKLGAQAASSVYLNYAYRLRLNLEDTERLSFGIGAGMTQYSLDGTRLEPGPGDEYDPILLNGKISSFVPDVRFGVYYYNPKWYLGASVMDLLSGEADGIFKYDEYNEHNISRRRHLYIIAGTLIDFNRDLKLRPSLLLQEDFKGPTSLDLNAMMIFNNRFWFGAGYRTGVTLWNKEYKRDQSLSSLNSMSAIAQFYINDRLRIGYSFDYILSRLSNLQSGTHEITLGLTFPRKDNRLISPRFF